MKILKKVSLFITAISMVLVVGGCGTKQEELGANFELSYEAEKTVDRIVYKVGELDGEMTPMHEDKKIKKGYRVSALLNEDANVDCYIEIIDEGKTIYKIEDVKLDLGPDKKAIVKIVDGKDGQIDVKIDN